MSKVKIVKKILIILLMIIAAVVFILQVRASAWPLISLYWLVLTIKNTLDVMYK